MQKKPSNQRVTASGTHEKEYYWGQSRNESSFYPAKDVLFWVSDDAEVSDRPSATAAVEHSLSVVMREHVLVEPMVMVLYAANCTPGTVSPHASHFVLVLFVHAASCFSPPVQNEQIMHFISL